MLLLQPGVTMNNMLGVIFLLWHSETSHAKSISCHGFRSQWTRSSLQLVQRSFSKWHPHPTLSSKSTLYCMNCLVIVHCKANTSARFAKWCIMLATSFLHFVQDQADSTCSQYMDIFFLHVFCVSFPSEFSSGSAYNAGFVLGPRWPEPGGHQQLRSQGLRTGGGFTEVSPSVNISLSFLLAFCRIT